MALRSIRSYGRASYIFNPTIEGIERADAMLIIGANPRFEASVLNARIRKRWRAGDVPVGVIGEVGDTRYDYETLGAGPESLRDLADGKASFFEVLKKADAAADHRRAGRARAARRRGRARPCGEAGAGGRTR